MSTTTQNDTVTSRVRALIEDNHLRGIWMATVSVTPAPVHGLNPGALYIKTPGGNYLGKITANNELRVSHPLTDEQMAELRTAAVGGIDALKMLGKLSGICNFCGRTLEDPDSVERGYGPVCAKKYGLEHPNRHGF